MEITGAGGRDLREHWSGGAHAHLGMAVPGLPEHVRHVRAEHEHLGRLDHLLPRGAGRLHPPGARSSCARAARGAIEVRAEVEAASDRELQARFAGTAWTQCDSWYRDERGRIVANWPGYMREYLRQTARSSTPAEYRFAPLPTASPRERLARARSGMRCTCYDYMIVGAGSAGLRARQPPVGGPVGARAAARGRRQGPLAEHQDPGGVPRSSSTPSSTGTSRPSPSRTSTAARCTSRAARCSAARSSMNAMLYVRGRPLDYDGWEAQGAPGWGYADVLPYFMQSEDNVRGASEYHGAGGPLRVSEQRSPRPMDRALAGGQRGRRDPAHRRLQRPRAGRRLDVPGDAAQRAALQRRRRLPAPGAHAPQPRGAHQRDRARRRARRRARGRRARCARGRGGEEVVRAEREVLLSRRRDRLAAAAAAVGHRAGRGAARGRRAGRATTCPASGATSRTTRS